MALLSGLSTQSKPYPWLQSVMQQGLWSPAQIEGAAQQQAKSLMTGWQSNLGQAADRAAALGYRMPYLLGGVRPTGDTLAASTATAQMRNQLGMQNRQFQMQAAGQLGQLASILPQIEMTPTAPTETPDWYGQIAEQVKELLGQIAAAQPAAGWTRPLAAAF